MTWQWKVWLDDCHVRHFPTLQAAERYAHRYVACTDERGFARRAAIHHNFRHVADVRLDAAGHVWTDVLDCTAV